MVTSVEGGTMTDSQNQRPPSPECDIVMRGGITSGVKDMQAVLNVI